MTRIAAKLFSWYPDRVVRQAAARDGTVQLEVFMVGSEQVITMTLYDTDSDGRPDLSREIGSDAFTKVNKSIEWSALRADLDKIINA